MKKYLFFAGLAALSLSFVACGSDDDNGGGSSQKQTITLSEAPFAKDAAYMDLDDTGEQLILDLIDEDTESNILNALPAEIDFTANGDAFICLAEGVYSDEGKGIYEDLSSKTLAALLGSYQKGELPFQYIKSTYTHSGDTYTIANYGTVKKAAGNRVNISLTAAAFSDNFNGSLEIGGAASHNNTTYLCRKWSIANVEVKASNGEKTFSASSTLYNIVTSIIKDGLLDMNGSDMTDYDKFGRFVNFYFSQNERLVALYGNNHIYTGEWEWSNAAKGTFTYDLEHSFMGNVLFPNVSTSCKAEFNASTCVFTLTSKYTYQKKTYSLDVAFTLR